MKTVVMITQADAGKGTVFQPEDQELPLPDALEIAMEEAEKAGIDLDHGCIITIVRAPETTRKH